MANRFRAAVKTTTINVERTDIEVDEDGAETGRTIVPTFQYETRLQGHGSIIRTIASHPGLDAIIEDAVDSMIKRAKAKPGGSTMELVQSIMSDLEKEDMSIGALVSKIVRTAPDVVADLLAAGAVLQDGETVEDFVEWLESLTLSEIISVATQWYRFNFEGGLGPFVRGLMAYAKPAPAAAPSAPSPKPAARQMGMRRAG